MFIRRSKCAPSSLEKGAVVVEMAIVAPVLFILLFGVIEFGRALNAYMMLHNIVNEGARSGQQLAELEVGKISLYGLPEEELDGKHCPALVTDGPQCLNHTIIQSRMIALLKVLNPPVTKIQMETEYITAGGPTENTLRVTLAADYDGLFVGAFMPIQLRITKTVPYLF